MNTYGRGPDLHKIPSQFTLKFSPKHNAVRPILAVCMCTPHLALNGLHRSEINVWAEIKILFNAPGESYFRFTARLGVLRIGLLSQDARINVHISRLNIA